MSPTISVLIASLGRAALRDTLTSVGRATVPPGETVEVIVADDSEDGAVERLLGGRHPGVRIVPVGARNVSRARNACLDAAQGKWLLFVDDDESVASDWIEQHLAVAREFGADAVFGPVYHLYPASAPEWFKAADPLFQDWRWHETGRRVVTGRTGNTLLRRDTVEQLGLRFDEAFGTSGGEDDEFFRRMGAADARMVVTDRARAWEVVDEDRANAAYIVARSQRSGQTHAMVALRGKGAIGSGVFAAAAIAKLAISGVGFAVTRPFSRTLGLKLRMRMASNIGKLRAVARAELGSSWTGLERSPSNRTGTVT